MEETEKIVLQIIETFYPEWIAWQKKKYIELQGYNLYKQVLLDAFGYDLDRATIEQERAVDTSSLERRLELMKLQNKLKLAEKKKKGRRK